MAAAALTRSDWSLMESCLWHVPGIASCYAGPGRDPDEIESAVRWGLVDAALAWRGGPPGAAFESAAVARMHWAARHAIGRSVVLPSGHNARRATLPILDDPAATWPEVARPDDRPGRLEVAEEVEALCRGLSPEETLAVRLVHLHGRSVGEAAAELGWPRHKLENRLHTARGVMIRTARERERRAG